MQFHESASRPLIRHWSWQHSARHVAVLDGHDASTVNRQPSAADDKYCRASGLDAISEERKQSLAAAGVGNVEIYNDALGGDSSSSDSDADDADWSPKKSLYGNQSKRTKPPACLRFKLKTDPVLDNELNAIRNDGTGGDGTGAREAKTAIGNKRSHKRSLAPKSQKSKFKYMSHKKSRLQTDAKNRIRSVRSKDGPKWEKKVSIFTEYKLLILYWYFLFFFLHLNREP